MTDELIPAVDAELVLPDDPDERRQLVAVEIEKLDVLERLCHEQFARSCGDEETVVETWEVEDEEGRKHQVPEGTLGAVAVIKRTRKGQSGNPAYIRALTDIARHRDRLKGLAEPARVHVDKTERKLVITEIVVKDRAELEAMKAAGLLK